jgi:transcriptional regulator with XRE-family HTH domain
MVSVGERLKLERESRNTTLDEMVVATGIGQSYLDALERGAIDELPGKAFGKLYIRAYAEVFGFDPQPWIDDYDREQRLVQGPSAEPTRTAPTGSRPVAEAISRWKAARAAADKAGSAAEDVATQTAHEPAPETTPETTPETVPEVVAPVPDIPPEPPTDRVEMVPESAAPVVIHDLPVHAPAARRFAGPMLILGIIVVASAIYLGMRGTVGNKADRTSAVSAPTTSATPPRVVPSAEPRSAEPPPPVAAKPASHPPNNAPAPATTDAGSELTVSEFGVGLRVVNLQLEGESDHFAEGVRVCFASRVLGGSRGDRIRHVWLYEGRVEQSIPLRLGGPDFRTHSNKTLGHAGQWAVEARDERGSVLARASFTCVPGRP